MTKMFVPELRPYESHFSSSPLPVFDHNPEKHARLLIQMTKTFLELANIEESVKNRKKAVVFFARSLRRFSIFTSPFQYGAVHSMIGDVYKFLGDELDPVRNYNQAIQSYKEALMFYPEDTLPTNYTCIQKRLDEVAKLLAETTSA